MWYYPASFCIGIRDVIGAWLVCLVIAAGFCGWAMSADGEPADERPGMAVSALGPFSHAAPYCCLEQLAQEITIAEAAMTVLREGRMIRHLALQTEPAESSKARLRCTSSQRRRSERMPKQ
jgi:hypothetical protein